MVAPAFLELLSPIPSDEHLEGQPVPINSFGRVTSMGTPPKAATSPPAPLLPSTKTLVTWREIWHCLSRCYSSSSSGSVMAPWMCQPGVSHQRPHGDTRDTGGEGTVVAPAPLLLPISITRYEHVEG